MDIRSCRALKENAREDLAQTNYDPKKLTLIHSGVLAAVSLVLLTVNYLLAHGIDQTGGLSGMGLRSILATIQEVLQYAQALITPLWGVGFTCVVLKIARGQQVGPQDLLHGFRRFAPFLRLTIIQSLLFAGLMFIGIFIGVFIFMMTPLGDSINASIQADPQALATGQISEATMAIIEDSAELMLLFGLVPMALLVLPLYYKYRLSAFVLLDFPERGALYAMRTSRFLMKRKSMQLFKLDLSFWWFYLLEVLISVIAYLDVIATALGFTLPIDPVVAYFATVVLSLAVQLVMHWQFRAQVEVSYAEAFEVIRVPDTPPTEMVPQFYGFEGQQG